MDESFLTGIDAFRGLAPRQVRDILSQATRLSFEAETTVFHEGSEAERFYLLLDGYLRVVRTSPMGEEIIALYIPPGQLFGIAAALGQAAYPATAVAAADCVVLSWPTRLWAEFERDYPGFSLSAHQTVGTRLTELHKRLMEMATQQVEQRVACALLRVMEKSGPDAARAGEIAFPITRQHVSEMSGTTLHTVSRLLSSWEKAGIVKSRRKHITIVNPAALSALTEGCD